MGFYLYPPDRRLQIEPEPGDLFVPSVIEDLSEGDLDRGSTLDLCGYLPNSREDGNWEPPGRVGGREK